MQNRLMLSADAQNRIIDTFLSSPVVHELIEFLKHNAVAEKKYRHSVAALNEISAEELERVKLHGYRGLTKETRQRLAEAREKDKGKAKR